MTFRIISDHKAISRSILLYMIIIYVRLFIKIIIEDRITLPSTHPLSMGNKVNVALKRAILLYPL